MKLKPTDIYIYKHKYTQTLIYKKERKEEENLGRKYTEQNTVTIIQEPRDLR